MGSGQARRMGLKPPGALSAVQCQRQRQQQTVTWRGRRASLSEGFDCWAQPKEEVGCRVVVGCWVSPNEHDLFTIIQKLSTDLNLKWSKGYLRVIKIFQIKYGIVGN
jgi:hypothetical protein